MAFTVDIIRGAGPTVLYTFQITPGFAPSIDYRRNEVQPVRILTGRIYRWALPCVLYPSGEVGYNPGVSNPEQVLVAAWERLRAVVEVRGANQPTGIRFRRDGNLVEEINSLSAGGAYDDVSFDGVDLVENAMNWRSELHLRVRVTAERKFVVQGIVDLKESLSYAYDERGLLVRTLAGRVTTASGTSAEAAARTLGLAAGGSSAFLTRGPEGVDVTVEDQAGEPAAGDRDGVPPDTAASFRSVVATAGRSLPGGVAPDFSVVTTTARQDGKTTTTVAATGRGPGAENGVRAQRPGGSLVSESVSVDPWQLTASAVYVLEETRRDETKRRSITTTREFALRGGGRTIVYADMSGDAPPERQDTALQPVEVREAITILSIGATGLADFDVPPPAFPEDHSEAEEVPGVPRRTKAGAERSGDEWMLAWERTYRLPSRASVMDVLGPLVFQVPAGETPEAAAAGAELPGGGPGGALFPG